MPISWTDPTNAKLTHTAILLSECRIPPLPIHRPTNILDLLQRCPQLHDTKPDHPRIPRQQIPHSILSLNRTVEAHDEVVAAVVAGLMFVSGAGEQEDAPVGDAADDAAGPEHDSAGCAGDSKRRGC